MYILISVFEKPDVKLHYKIDVVVEHTTSIFTKN